MEYEIAPHDGLINALTYATTERNSDMIDVDAIIAASNGLWDATITWYNIGRNTVIPLVISVCFMCACCGSIISWGFRDDPDPSLKKIRIGTIICIIIGVCAAIVYGTGWCPPNAHSAPGWRDLVCEAYGREVVTDNGPDALGTADNYPFAVSLGNGASDAVVNLVCRDANNNASDCLLIVENDCVMLIDLDANEIVEPVVNEEVLAKRLAELAK